MLRLTCRFEVAWVLVTGKEKGFSLDNAFG